MTTREAIQALAQLLKDERVICTTGYACRDLQACGDRPENFYMIGSMGLAAGIGLGVALAKPDSAVVIFDGDGAVLMGLGALPMIGSLKPKHFFHVVFDNGVFASTGGQPTYSSTVALDRLAAASGYRVVRKAQTSLELADVWKRMRGEEGPGFLLVKCRADSGPAKERVRLDPPAIADRFREALHAV